MKRQITLGVVCLTRGTFDHEEAARMYERTKAELGALENVTVHAVARPVMEADEAESAARQMAARPPDGLVILSGTFHLGHLALVLYKHFPKTPILLWAYNEPPYNGGKIRLNSVCGVNLDASNLYKAGAVGVHCIVADYIDELWVDAVRMRAALSNARVGMVGAHAHGFFNLDYDEMQNFREYGLLVDHYEIAEMHGQPVDEAERKAGETALRVLFDCTGVTDAQAALAARLCVSTQKFMQRYRLDAAAVRCWPEYAAAYGIAPCAMMSVLQSRGVILGCEGDLEGTLSMLAAASAGAETPFLADLSQVNPAEDFALMWHCGAAPANLWDGKSVRSLDTYFAGGRGLTADFVLKSGTVSLVRIDSALGRTRLFIAGGRAVPMEKQIKGTYAKVLFEQGAKALLDTVTSAGVAHHIAMVYGEYRPVFALFAKIMGWELIA
jgi:L-fucose isomerase-like protein